MDRTLLGAMLCLALLVPACGSAPQPAALPALPPRVGRAAPPEPLPPCEGVAIAPGDSLQQAVDANPEGTTFCLNAGIHRLATAVPRSGQRFIGEGPDTVLSGARILNRKSTRLNSSHANISYAVFC